MFFLSLESTWSNFRWSWWMYLSPAEALRSPKQQSTQLCGTFPALCDSSFKTLKTFGRGVSDPLSSKPGTWGIFITLSPEVNCRCFAFALFHIAVIFVCLFLAWQIWYIIWSALRKSKFIWYNSRKEKARYAVYWALQSQILFYWQVRRFWFITAKLHAAGLLSRDKRKNLFFLIFCCKQNSKLVWVSFYSGLQGSARKKKVYLKSLFAGLERKQQDGDQISAK